MTLTDPTPAPPAEYRQLLDHTSTCTACNSRCACPTGDALRAAERETRR